MNIKDNPADMPAIPEDEIFHDSQTEPDSTSDEGKAPAIQVETPEEPPIPQTDSETEGILSAKEAEGAHDPPNPQTEPETAEDKQLSPGDDADPDDKFPDAQTDTEKLPDEDADQDTAGDTPEPSKTEKKPTRKRSPAAKTGGSKRRSVSKKSESDTEDENSSQSDISEPISAQSDSEAAEPKKTASRQSRTSRRSARRNEPIVSIDEERTVQTTADKLQSDLLDLVESMKTRKVLTGTIQGVERSEENQNLSFAVIYHGEFKVIIPAEETVEPPADFRDRLPGDVMHYLVTKRLGAEVDFIVKGVDPKSGIAAASRLEAMAAKRREYYFGTDRDGNNLLYEGISAEARIVSVIRAGIFVDLFGVETYIPLRELSYQRWVDAGNHYQAGQRVLVKILSLDRNDCSNIKVTA